MAKNQNTFEKRRREMEKRQRAEEKRKRRQTKKNAAAEPMARTAPRSSESDEAPDIGSES